MMTVSTASEFADTQVAIIDYGLGNVRSVSNALDAIGAKACISNDISILERADCLILPGVGAFQDGMNNLHHRRLVAPLSRLVLEQKKPILGICLGMQLLTKKSYENGEYNGLGWIDADVVRFPHDMHNNTNQRLKVPHVGWNDIRIIRDSFLNLPIETFQSFYFVHSYYLHCRNQDNVVAVCEYGLDFAAILQNDNIYAAQFHPEKSQKHGLELLRCFLRDVQHRQRIGMNHA